jgi:NADPH-dependent 2,4-dienoyl-CoA reductase/sulfur reductase-like enzyme
MTTAVVTSQSGGTAQDGAFTHDLVIIGSGPAGMSAALAATMLKLRVVVLDEQPRPGGQIYRNVTEAKPTVTSLLGPDYTRGADLAQRFSRADIEVHYQTLVWDVARDLTVTAQQLGRSFQVRAPQLIVANGAIERPSPLQGWTLPGVLNAGAAQIALKTAAQVPDGRVVLVGGGPLLLLVGCQLIQAGAQVAAVVETSPASNRLRAARHSLGAMSAPALLAKGARMMWELRRAGVPRFKHATDVRIVGSNPTEDGSRRAVGVEFATGDFLRQLKADAQS